MVKKEAISKMMPDENWLEYPLCPYCGELTHLGGEFTPCCGRENEKEPEEFVRLVPVNIVEA